MQSWCAADVCDFLERADLHGPAQVCRQNGVAGADLLELTEAGLQTDLRFTPFAARKIVTVRDAFLVYSGRHFPELPQCVILLQFDLSAQSCVAKKKINSIVKSKKYAY